MRVVARMGSRRGSAARTAAAGRAMAAAGVGGGGAIHVEADGNAEWPRTSETKSRSPSSSSWRIAAMQSSHGHPAGRELVR